MTKSAWFVMGVSMVASACGGSNTPEPAVADPAAPPANSEATPAEPTQASGAGPEAAAPEAPARGKRAPCVLGQDQTCNGDPSVSAIWGKCTEGGTCECHPGFTLAPTGYCQPQP